MQDRTWQRASTKKVTAGEQAAGVESKWAKLYRAISGVGWAPRAVSKLISATQYNTFG